MHARARTHVVHVTIVDPPEYLVDDLLHIRLVQSVLVAIKIVQNGPVNILKYNVQLFIQASVQAVHTHAGASPFASAETLPIARRD
jgi:hypothetical protein